MGKGEGEGEGRVSQRDCAASRARTPHLNPLPLAKGRGETNAMGLTTGGHYRSRRNGLRIEIDDRASAAPGSPRRMEPHGCERHRWVKPRGRNERERMSQSVLWRTVIDAAPLALNTHYCVALKSYINFTEGSAKLP